MAESGKPVKEVQITDRSCPYREHKLRVPGEEFTREFLLEQISVLIEQIEEMSHLNAKLSSRIEKTQPKSASSISTQGLSPRSSADPSARRSAGNEETENFEITWSDQGGLPNSLGSPDNPFSRRRPGR
jgi:hypothetical protein